MAVVGDTVWLLVVGALSNVIVPAQGEAVVELATAVAIEIVPETVEDAVDPLVES